MNRSAGDLTSLLKQLEKSTDESARGRVVDAIGRMGPRAMAAVPKLIGEFRRGIPATVIGWEVNYLVEGGAALALSRIGPGAQAELLQGLNSSEASIRLRCLVTLTEMKPVDHRVEQALRSRVRNDSDGEVRAIACRGLGRIGHPNEEVSATLAEALGDKEVRVRMHALGSLQRLGAQTEEVVAAVAIALQDNTSSVRLEAARTLGGIRPARRQHASDVAKLLKADRVWERIAVACILGEMGPEAGAALGPLLDSIRSHDIYVVREATVAIRRIDPANDEVVRALLELADHSDPTVRCAGASGLGALGADGLSGLRRALQDADADVRVTAASALIRLSDNRQDTVPVLVTGLEDGRRHVRYAAAVALGEAGPEARTAVPMLRSLLHVGDEGMKSAVNKALLQIGRQ
ncbi:MAG: HEAT repeat domain-containing protein [Pirellulales bacterium]